MSKSLPSLLRGALNISLRHQNDDRTFRGCTQGDEDKALWRNNPFLRLNNCLFDSRLTEPERSSVAFSSSVIAPMPDMLSLISLWLASVPVVNSETRDTLLLICDEATLCSSTALAMDTR